MTNTEIAALLRLLAGQIENLGAVPQPSVPAMPQRTLDAVADMSPPADVQAANAPPPAPPSDADHHHAILPDAPPAPAPSVAPPPRPTNPIPPSPPEVPAPPKPVIDLDTIKGIQQAFNSIRGPNHPKLDEDGVDDKVFAWALKEFQATLGIPVTGKPDKITIDTLHKAIFGAPKP